MSMAGGSGYSEDGTVSVASREGIEPPPECSRALCICNSTLQQCVVTEKEGNFPDEELVALKHKGKVKEIREKKIPVELKDVFMSCREVRKVVLVEGVAGAGKSSMVINACREWGSLDFSVHCSYCLRR